MRKITHKKKSVPRLLTAIALALSLNACELSSSGRQVSLYDITAPSLESSSFYMQKAVREPTAQTDWYLLAVKAFIRENRLNEASNLILRLAKMPLTDIQLSEWQLNRAEVLSLRGNPQSAVESLNFLPGWQLPAHQWQRYFTLQAKLYEKVGDLDNALISLINLASYSPAGNEQALSDKTWSVLTKMSVEQLQNLAGIHTGSAAIWADLATKLRKSSNPKQQQLIIDNWVKTYPNTLGARFLPTQLTKLADLQVIKPSNIGIILPFTNKFALQGETIRNGLMQAILNDTSTEKKPTVNFYDTNAMPMTAIVEKMRLDGVEFVIGPLQKNKVEEFIKLNQGEFRHLAMNIPQTELINSDTCFFTLAPEQEAQQAAIHISRTHDVPVVIAPENDLGRRVSEAFVKQWRDLTGNSVKVEYFANSNGMQKAVRNALGLSSSQTRINQLENMLGLDMESEARSRRDVDAVYLVADSGELTLLKPYVEVAINPDAPQPKLFASSRSNNQIRSIGVASELSGIEFSDVPLLVNPQSPEAKQFHRLWPDMSNNMVRLYSLGIDAYALIEALPQMQASSAFQIEGESGTLFLEQPCTVSRELPWAVFTETGVEAIE